MPFCLAACQAKNAPSPNPIPPAIQNPQSVQGFVDPEPATWVSVMPAVREYFYYRKLAVIAGDPAVLWDHYPALKIGQDYSKDINSEAFFINNMRTFDLIDGNIYPEMYDKIKVRLSTNEADVLVHGMELYLYKDGARGFNESGGEFKIILFLIKQGEGWSLTKTQDISGP